MVSVEGQLEWSGSREHVRRLGVVVGEERKWLHAQASSTHGEWMDYI